MVSAYILRSRSQSASNRYSVVTRSFIRRPFPAPNAAAVREGSARCLLAVFPTFMLDLISGSNAGWSSVRNISRNTPR